MEKDVKTKVRIIRVDDDCVSVRFQFDEQCRVWLGEYPFFKDEPRTTPSGRPWRNATYTECPHHGNPDFNDCGSCEHFRRAEQNDLIGVCFNDLSRRRSEDTGCI